MIRVEHLYYKYHENSKDYAILDLNFHVKSGEWVSIVGHNGSGKSTTVRLIDGLLTPEKGQIFIAGRLMTLENIWDCRRKIGLVFQNPDNQFVGATVEDDVAFGLENQGIPPEEMKVRVEEALELVGMLDFKEKEPARLSGGQKQRVAIAGVVALAPQILILDEATSMLDPKGRLELMELVRNVRKKTGMTVLSITHDLDEISFSDRVLVMQEGKLLLDEPPRSLFSRKNLQEFGLDEPFENQLKNLLVEKGMPLPENYLTEKELQEYLWELS